MSAWDTVKKAISVIAPTVASVIGGPIAGVAVSELSNLLLGKPDGSPDELLTAFNGATADKLLQLKQLESETQLKLKQLEIDVAKLDYDDTANARQRQIDIAKYTGKGDVVQDTLAIMIVAFVGLMTVALYFVKVPAESAPLFNTAYGNMLGLGGLVVGFYFGSSRGAKSKDSMVDKK
jgi:hypothetical protein